MQGSSKKILLFAGLLGFVIASCAVLFFVIYSGPQFSVLLEDYDRAFLSGETLLCDSILKRAKKKCSTAENWLSIIKRLYNQENYLKTLECCEKALDSFPGNQTLRLVYSSIAVKAGEYILAGSLAPGLDGEAGYALRLWIENKKEDLSEKDAYVYKNGGRLLNNPDYLVNSALIFSLSGDYSNALSCIPSYTGEAFSQVPLMWALLNYDAGNYPKAYYWATLVGNDETEYNKAEALAVMGDVSYLQNNFDSAVAAWQSLIAGYGHVFPHCWYNLYSLKQENNNYLRNLLYNFPDFLPALQAVAHSAFVSESQKSRDLYEESLVTEGIYTLAMEEEKKNPPFSYAEVDSFFSAAGNTGLKDNPLFDLEKCRYGELKRQGNTNTSDLWFLLEKYPDTPEVARYTMWRFFSAGDVENGCLVYNNWISDNSVDEEWLPFFGGLVSAVNGNYKQAMELFRRTAGDDTVTWQAMGNMAVVAKYSGDWKLAADLFTDTSGVVQDRKMAALFHIEAGKLFAEHNIYDRAATSFGYAMDLAPDNYEAKYLYNTVRNTVK